MGFSLGMTGHLHVLFFFFAAGVATMADKGCKVMAASVVPKYIGRRQNHRDTIIATTYQYYYGHQSSLYICRNLLLLVILLCQHSCRHDVYRHRSTIYIPDDFIDIAAPYSVQTFQFPLA